MTIHTRTHKPTRVEALRLLLARAFLYRWWFWVLVAIASVAAVLAGGQVLRLYVLWWVAFLILALWSFQRILKSNADQGYLRECAHEFDGEFMITRLPDGGEQRIRLEHLVKAYHDAGRWSLYETYENFWIIPDTAFESPDDVERLSSLLRERNLLRTAPF